MKLKYGIFEENDTKRDYFWKGFLIGAAVTLIIMLIMSIVIGGFK